MKPLTVVFSEESFNQNLRKKHRPQKKLDFFVKECYNEWNANKKELPSCGVTNMKKDLSKEFKRRKIQKPSQPLAFFVMHIMRLICRRRKVAFVYDEEYRALEKQQAIFLCQHKSSLDYIYVFAGLGRLDVHVLCGYQNIFQRFVYTLLKKLGGRVRKALSAQITPDLPPMPPARRKFNSFWPSPGKSTELITRTTIPVPCLPWGIICFGMLISGKP